MANLRVQRRRSEGDHGATLVEFALILPLLVLLLLGTLTGGLTLSRQNSVKNAVRETSRYGAILTTFTNHSTNLSDLYLQTVAAATGDLDVGTPGRVICVALLDGNTWRYSIYRALATPAATETNASEASGTAQGSLPAAVQTACRSSAVPLRPASETPTVRRVWVRAARESDIEAMLYRQTVTLDGRSLTRYER